MPIAAPASARATAGTAKPKSSNNVMVPSAWAAPAIMAYNSASALDKALVACVLDQLFTQCLPNITTPPLVLRQVLLQPAQSESVKTSSISGMSYRSNFWIYLGAPPRYLPIILNS